MKNSGIEWIGEIPSHWDVIPNKYVMSKTKEICLNHTDEDIISLTKNGVIIRDLNAGGKMPATFDGYQKVYSGNLLMCLFDIDVTPRCIGIIKNDGLTSPAYSQFVLNNDNDISYYYYYYLMLDEDKTLLHLSKNLRHSLTEDQLGSIKIIKPPLKEQILISNFLDKTLNDIDDVINKSIKLIEKYNEYKHSLITEVITKGLNNNVILTDSGINWIGEIPKHWEVKKLNYASSDENHSFIDGPFGSDLKNEEYVDEGVPIIQLNNIKAGTHDFTNEHFITEEKYIQLKKHSVKPGDIVIAKMAPVARATIVSDKYDKYIISTDCIKLNCNSNFLNKYVTYSLNSYMYHDAVQKANGITRLRINLSSLKKTKVLMPPLDEQYEIVKYLDEKCARIDSLITKREQLIDKLKEYKKSLIFEYVTGKKEVPNEI